MQELISSDSEFLWKVSKVSWMVDPGFNIIHDKYKHIIPSLVP